MESRKIVSDDKLPSHNEVLPAIPATKSHGASVRNSCFDDIGVNKPDVGKVTTSQPEQLPSPPRPSQPSSLNPPAPSEPPAEDGNSQAWRVMNKPDVGKGEPAVTSQPEQLPPLPPPAEGGKSRAQKALEMMALLHDTRQQISALRQRTEEALACVQQTNSERRQQLEDIQSAKAQLSLVYAQLATIANNQNISKTQPVTTSSEQPPPNLQPDHADDQASA